jgi:hypothetical protein
MAETPSCRPPPVSSWAPWKDPTSHRSPPRLHPPTRVVLSLSKDVVPHEQCWLCHPPSCVVLSEVEGSRPAPTPCEVPSTFRCHPDAGRISLANHDSLRVLRASGAGIGAWEWGRPRSLDCARDDIVGGRRRRTVAAGARDPSCVGMTREGGRHLARWWPGNEILRLRSGRHPKVGGTSGQSRGERRPPRCISDATRGG